ncbi:MAG TPA: glycosyltransferase family 2 protein [Candidatus Dormibacteraeota bacterium]|nr:glycosyltransferase family 2 protein [Candidatus Dormibacteraeota bacterium]
MTAMPGISVLIPTLNAERYLEKCLRSLREQDYPAEEIEIIAADAGSSDSTLDLLARYRVDRVVPNPGVTGEAARAILNRLATRELILSIDADNYLVGRDWLRRMVRPLQENAEVFAAEPVRWDYTPNDPPLNRYFALTGINDPVSLFIGNYGRYNHITGKWTEMNHHEEARDGYLIAELEPEHVPTLGANGFLARTEVVRKASTGQYYFDIDVVNELVSAGCRRIAKVDAAVGHQFARDLSTFSRKTRRRIEDFLFWREQRSYPWLSSGRLPIVRFAVSTLLVVPLLWQAIRGWVRVRDRAWLYHVPVCWMTLWLYGWAVIRSGVRREPHSREGWEH